MATEHNYPFAEFEGVDMALLSQLVPAAGFTFGGFSHIKTPTLNEVVIVVEEEVGADALLSAIKAATPNALTVDPPVWHIGGDLPLTLTGTPGKVVVVRFSGMLPISARSWLLDHAGKAYVQLGTCPDGMCMAGPAVLTFAYEDGSGASAVCKATFG